MASESEVEIPSSGKRVIDFSDGSFGISVVVDDCGTCKNALIPNSSEDKLSIGTICKSCYDSDVYSLYEVFSCLLCKGDGYFESGSEDAFDERFICINCMAHDTNVAGDILIEDISEDILEPDVCLDTNVLANLLVECANDIRKTDKDTGDKFLKTSVLALQFLISLDTKTESQILFGHPLLVPVAKNSYSCILCDNKLVLKANTNNVYSPLCQACFFLEGCAELGLAKSESLVPIRTRRNCSKCKSRRWLFVSQFSCLWCSLGNLDTTIIAAVYSIGSEEGISTHREISIIDPALNIEIPQKSKYCSTCKQTRLTTETSNTVFKCTLCTHSMNKNIGTRTHKSVSGIMKPSIPQVIKSTVAIATVAKKSIVSPSCISTKNIYILPDVWTRLMGYVQLCTIEISGLGLVEEIPEGLVVTDVFLPTQVGGPATTLVSAEETAKVVKILKDSDREEGTLTFWWHSHVDMKAIPSATDQRTFNELSSLGSLPFGPDYFISVILNRATAKDITKGYYRIDIYNPINVTHLFTPIIGKPMRTELKKIRDEIEEKVTHSIPTGYNSNKSPGNQFGAHLGDYGGSRFGT